MRFDIRLKGTTESGRPCVMELTVFAQSQDQLLERAQQQSTEGPWFYRDNNDPVPTSEKITVEGVEEMKKKQSPTGRDPSKWLKRS